MKIKVNEAKGIVLDYLVAKSIGRDARFKDSEENWVTKDSMSYDPVGDYTPSTDWTQGGPIIQQERISTCFEGTIWVATLFNNNCGATWYGNQYGHTPLVAAMRCYVASNLGNEVEVPDDFVILS